MKKSKTDLLTLVLIMAVVMVGLLMTWIRSGHAQGNLVTSWNAIGQNPTVDALACMVAPIAQSATANKCYPVAPYNNGMTAAVCEVKPKSDPAHTHIYRVEGSYNGVGHWQAIAADMTLWQSIAWIMYEQSNTRRFYYQNMSAGASANCTVEAAASGQLVGTYAGSL
jgi:hypothetical protein